MCFDVIGCHATDTVICDSGEAFAISSLPATSNHLIHLIISFHLFPRPTPSPRLFLVCLL